MIWTPRVTVAAVIERNNRFLLVEEMIHGRRVLNQPAGHLEADESLQSAIIREVWEETARNFIPSALTGIYRWHTPDKDLTYLRFCFSGTVSERTPGRPLDKGILDTCWLDLESLQTHSHLRSPMVLQCIQDYRANQLVPLELLHDIV